MAFWVCPFWNEHFHNWSEVSFFFPLQKWRFHVSAVVTGQYVESVCMILLSNAWKCDVDGRKNTFFPCGNAFLVAFTHLSIEGNFLKAHFFQLTCRFILRTTSQGQHSFLHESSRRIITRQNRAIELIWESLQHSYAKVWWGKAALWSAAHPLQLCAIRHAEFPSSASLTVACSGVCWRQRLYQGWNETLQRLNPFLPANCWERNDCCELCYNDMHNKTPHYKYWKKAFWL